MSNNRKIELPIGWEWANLENVADILDNRRVPVNAKEREGRQGDVPYYGATGQVGYIDDYLFDEELVLLGEDGAPFFDPSKQKAYIVRGKSWVNNHAHVLRTKAGIPNSYLKYYLDIVDYHGFVTGTTRAKLNQKAMRDIPIPLAPPNQQTRIVAEIEKQFSRLDEAVANLKRVKANLKRYKAAVLKAAVEGKLTEEWRKNNPDVEPADKLLARILAERRANWQGRGKYKEPVGPDTSGLPELPVGWVWSSVEKIAHVGTGATPLRSKLEYYENGKVPWVTSGALNNEYVSNASEYITNIALVETNAKLFPKHTLLVAMYGEGKTRGKVSELLIDAATNQACAAIVMTGLAEKVRRYIKLFFYKNYEDIRRLSSGGVQPNLNLSHIKQTMIPLPPLAEQYQIVGEVERRLSIVAGVEAQVDANLRRADRLRQSILKQAFSGQLVPQDENDEPASEMSERIRNDVGANNHSPQTTPKTQKRAQKWANINSPLRKPQQSPAPEPLPLVAESNATYGDAITARILAVMQPGREYARADLVELLGLTTGQWNAAILELKLRGQVQKVEEKRGARYELVRAEGGGR